MENWNSMPNKCVERFTIIIAAETASQCDKPTHTHCTVRRVGTEIEFDTKQYDDSELIFSHYFSSGGFHVVKINTQISNLFWRWAFNVWMSMWMSAREIFVVVVANISVEVRVRKKALHFTYLQGCIFCIKDCSKHSVKQTLEREKKLQYIIMTE